MKDSASKCVVPNVISSTNVLVASTMSVGGGGGVSVDSCVVVAGEKSEARALVGHSLPQAVNVSKHGAEMH